MENGSRSNAYSRQWFEFFHVGIDESRTIREVEFVCECAPLPDFRRLADFCYGMGRHSRAFANRGYSVTGIDRDGEAIAKARELAGGPEYVQADIRDYRPESGAFDLAMIMGQSFGHFDSATNRDVLERLAGSVRRRGRIVLDLWNPEFFAAHQGERELNTSAGIVHERKRVDGDRLFVQLNYPDRSEERFEWQLFSPIQMKALGETIDLDLLLACTEFTITSTPSSDKPRIQFVLEQRR
jgi:hypothetical protein